MVSVRNDNLAIGRISYEQEGRHSAAGLYFLLIRFDMEIADPKQGQTGRPENILRFKLAHRRPFQLIHQASGRLFIIDQ